jgi:hypothetical protein
MFPSSSFFSIKIYTKRKTNLPLCAQERDLIPLVVSLDISKRDIVIKFRKKTLQTPKIPKTFTMNNTRI